MKIFIGCGSNPKIDNNYFEETKKICKLLCNYKYDLVFGAYNEGLMGICYKIFLENNRDIYSVNINAYRNVMKDISESKIYMCDSIFDRIKTIFSLSDRFLILPGGTGTLTELFCLIDEFKNNKKDGKIIIYNYNNYYEELLNYLYQKRDDNFIYDTDFDNIMVINNIDELEREIKL